MSLIDWVVLCLYFSGMVVVGLFFNRSNHNSDDYFLGGRNMRPWTVGLSLFATLLSTITYLAMPGEVIKHGPMILAGLGAFPIIIWIVGWFIIPAFMKAPATSGFELLEKRFGLGIRMLGLVFFLFLRLLWMAMVIFLTAKAMVGPVMGLSEAYLPLISLALGLITVSYTSLGGLRAVVFTDVVQTFILFLGAILAIGIVTVHFGGMSWIPTEWNASWDAPIFWFNTEARVTFAGAVMLMFFWYICTAGGDQMAIQRYFATRDAKSARRAFTISMAAGIAINALLLLLGFALLAYYSGGGVVDVPAEPDMYFPDFIANVLPIGISGLVVAALMAAAMSSLSSGLNAICSVISIDLLGRFGKERNRNQNDLSLNMARFTSWIVGIVVVLISMGMGRISGNFLELTNKTSIFVAPLFYLFFMALFVRSATVAGTWIGAIFSLGIGTGIAFWGLFDLSFIWIIPVSLLSGILIGVSTSYCLGLIGKR